MKEATITGSTRDAYGIWYDGGTYASRKNYASIHGSYSMVLSAVSATSPDKVDDDGNYLDVDTESGKTYVKGTYGSVYSRSFDLSQTNSTKFSFRFLMVDSTGASIVNGNFRVEVSKDGGETFTTLKTYGQLAPIKNVKVATPDNWTSVQNLAIPYQSANTVIRIKTYFADNASNPQLYLDNFQIDYTGDAPRLSEETIAPDNDPPMAGRDLYDEAEFDSDSTEDWGVWTDGGRNAYTTAFLAESGVGNLVLRYRYLGVGVANPPAEDGSSQGDQKPTYSSVLTQNLDFTRVDDLQIEFAFTAYGIGISDQTPAYNTETETYDVTNTYFPCVSIIGWTLSSQNY